MFGYVKVYQPELKMGEFEQYRGVYCALCRTLGKRYGVLAQMTLSYDITFLSILHMALSGDCPGFTKGRCPYNPFKKCTCCQNNTALDACADAAMLLLYHKTLDTIADDRFFKRLAARLMLPTVRRYRRRAAAYLPELDTFVTEAMDRQHVLENERVASVDRAAEPTAQILARLCEVIAADDNSKRVLSRFGYCLGRWVYLMDATDDLEEDLKRDQYNPILLSRKVSDAAEIPAVRGEMLLSLNASLAECRAAYELLNVHRFDGILRNVLEWGIPHIQKRVLSGEKDTTRRLNHEKSV